MELLALIALVICIVIMVKAFNKQPPSVPPIDEPTAIDSELAEATRNLTRIIDECTRAAPDGFRILAKIASADGKVSRDDLLVMVRYAERLDAVIDPVWMDGLKRLNAGVSVKVTGTDALQDELATIARQPLLHIAQLYGSVIALTIGSKRISKSGKTLIDAVENTLAVAAAPVALPGEPRAPEKLSIAVDGPMTTDQNQAPLPELLPEPPPEPPAPPAHDWVAQAKAELAAERKR